MQYVIIDLEWNNAYSKKKAGYVNEIIEIGAVKMNSAREIVDTFRALVRPVVYRRLHSGTSAVIGLRQSDLAKGIPFREAASDFFKSAKSLNRPWLTSVSRRTHRLKPI